MTAIAVCTRCGQAELTVPCTKLWDDCTYCRDCVERACAGLFDYAKGNPTLDERVEADVLRSLHLPPGWAIRFTYRTAVLIALGVWMMFTGMQNSGLLTIGFGFIFGVVEGLFLWRGRSLLWPDASAPLRISAHDGCIECWRGEHRLVNAPLNEWSWWHSQFEKKRLGRLVVLGAPKSSEDAYYICGNTSDLRDRWIGFFKLIKMRRISAAAPF